jgi:hypothetical protein
MKPTALIAMWFALAGCAPLPWRAHEKAPSPLVIATTTSETPTVVTVTAESSIHERAKQGAKLFSAVPLTVSMATIYTPYGLIGLGISAVAAGAGAAAGVAFGAVEGVVNKDVVRNLHSQVNRTGFIPLIDGAHGNAALLDCFASHVPAASGTPEVTTTLELNWVSIELVPGEDAGVELDPRLSMRSTVTWAQRPGRDRAPLTTGTFTDRTVARPIAEWMTDEGAVAWADLRQSCLRLAQQVRAQVDPAETSQRVITP